MWVGIGLIVCGIGFMVSTGLLVRYAKLPPWTHRDLLAFIALVATVGGAVILTNLKWLQADWFNHEADRLINELVRERPVLVNAKVGEALTTIIDAQTWDQKFTSVGIIVVLLSLGLVISARTLKGKFLGNEFEMQTGEAQRAAAAAGAAATAQAAEEKAGQIASGAAPPTPDLPIPDAAPTNR